MFNNNFGEDESMALIGYAHDMAPRLCLWTHNGRSCCTIVLGRDFPAHLQNVHGVPGTTSRVQCHWSNCYKELRGDTFVRHVQEIHLKESWPCPRCLMLFSRRSVMNAHRANCTG
ncbi:hypothetical protein HYDPIDRAFT_113952 [Hydnomerulius pinastri MD-312]|uniref:Unplaced genomic scaffold scaffold_19, whole genome shotgun sequence n=1 Tax=Hydnomerulius pinastri MD-312 TaxID=994086 RepID=A0A0C9WD94_9AGAM|nr:hypothetical protein HYDPIDRAFT_113952 [Hydnomerulius pinastri MD-312]